MSDIERRSDRLATLRDRVERLPGYEGEQGTHIEAASPEGLLDRSPRAAACRIDAVNMATVYGERTDGCGSVGCLAALAILDCPEEAATDPLCAWRGPPTCRNARSACSTSPPGSSGSTPATRDAQFCGCGIEVVRGPRGHAGAGHPRRPKPHDGGNGRRLHLESPGSGAAGPLSATPSRPTVPGGPPGRPSPRHP